MKKVLFIKRSLGGGGAEKLLVETLRLFDYNRFQVTLLTSDPNGIYLDQVDSRVRICQVCDIWSSFILRNFFYYIPLLRKPIMTINYRRARKKLGGELFDISISYLEGRSASMHRGLMDMAERNVTWVHSDLFANPWSNRYHISFKDEAAYYNMVDEIVFVSEAAQKKFDLYIPRHAPARVVYNLIDFKQINIKANAFSVQLTSPSIVAVGRLAPEKRFDRLIESVKLLKDKGTEVNLYILGEGKLKDSLERYAESRHLRAYFLGFVSNPYPYIQTADLFVSSSDNEGYPLVVAEAMCLGKPIVATNVTGTCEMLSNGAGVLVALNENAISEACAELLKDNDARLSLGARAQLVARERFDVASYLQAFYCAIEGKM